jgi:hypothetical protein
MSYLWDSMWHLKLERNMRTKNDTWFVKYLLRIGEAWRRLMVMVKSAFLMIYVYHRPGKTVILIRYVNWLYIPCPQCQYVKQELHHLTSNIISAEQLGRYD